MFVKLPIHEMTQPKRAVANQPTENAAMPPDDSPHTQRRAGSVVIRYSASIGVSTSSRRKAELRSLTVSYSTDRWLVLGLAALNASFWPGVTKTAIVGGISPAAIMLSSTIGTDHSDSDTTYSPLLSSRR